MLEDDESTTPPGASMDLTGRVWVIQWRDHLCSLEDAFETSAERLEALAIVEYDAQVAQEAETDDDDA